MVPLIIRLSIKKLVNSTRKPSIALPVWVIVVSLTAYKSAYPTAIARVLFVAKFKY